MRHRIQILLAAALMAAMATGCGTFELAARPDPEHPSGYAAIQFWTPFGEPHARADNRPAPDHVAGPILIDESALLAADR